MFNFRLELPTALHSYGEKLPKRKYRKGQKVYYHGGYGGNAIEAQIVSNDGLHGGLGVHAYVVKYQEIDEKGNKRWIPVRGVVEADLSPRE